MPIANDEIVVSNLVLMLQLSALHYGSSVAASGITTLCLCHL